MNELIEKEKVYYRTIIKVMRLGHNITDKVTQELKSYGISEPQFNVLRILRGQKGKPINVQDIQKRMIQRSSNVTRIIDKLIDKGLVVRAVCPTNRRKMDITITEEGLKQLEQMSKKVYNLHQPMMSALSEKELSLLEDILEKLNQAL